MRLDECEALRAYTFANIDAVVAKVNAILAEVDAKLEALRARPGIAPSVHILSSTTTWMLSTTAAGSMLRIEEVCTRQDAHLEAFMADFRSFADDLDQRQPSKHASFALLDDDDNNDKDNAIHIILLIDDTDVELEDIAIILTPPQPLPYTGDCGCALPGGGMSAVVSQDAVGF